MSRSLRSRSICAPSPPLGNWFSTTVPAEQMGKKLKQRFERQKQRQGIKTGPTAKDEAELDRLLGQD